MQDILNLYLNIIILLFLYQNYNAKTQKKNAPEYFRVCVLWWD